jgi:hypothetical protein
MSGAIPLLPLCPFTVWTRTTLPLLFFTFLQQTAWLGNQTAQTEVNMCWLYYSVALMVVTRQVL